MAENLYAWISSLWLVWLFLAFVAIVAWTFWPTRKRRLERHGEIPLHDDDRER